MKRIIALLLTLVVFQSPAFAQGYVVTSSAAVTTSTSPAYTAGDSIGTLLTFNNVFGSQARSGVLLNVCITDKAAVAADISFVPATQAISATVTDNAPFDPNDADLPLLGREIPFTSTERVSYNDNGMKCTSSLGIAVRNTNSAAPRAMYGYLVNRGAATFSSTTDLTVIVNVLQD